MEETVTEIIDPVEEPEEEQGRASFEIHNGKEMVRFKALKDCWVMQVMGNRKNTTTGDMERVWESAKWFTDLGSIGAKVFDMRLKNCDATTLSELADCAKSIKAQLQAEFKLTGCGCNNR